MTGYTISVILFALTMNLVVKSVEPESRGPIRKSEKKQPPVWAFMDNLTLTTTAIPEARWILQGLERPVFWRRMSFRPFKACSLVLK